MIHSLFIANRGEIAVRIIRTAREMGIKTVLGYSSEDKESLAVRLSDESVCIGPASSIESYLNMKNILSAASITGCDAIHPGVGFLAENAEFAENVKENNIIFIGPDPEILKNLGDKIKARQLAIELEIPVIPGSEGSVETTDEAVEIGREVGYPLLLKAAAGGGGRGIRVVKKEDELQSIMQLVGKEASASFGDGTLFIERFLDTPRHVEVQLVGDRFGNVFVFGERDCTIQVNHQKIIEEQPATCMGKSIKEKMEKDAVKLFKKLHFVGAGTVEFLFSKGKYYFMEVNPRIQVEHPVTEMVEHVDLIELQILAAVGENLSEILSKKRELSRGNECSIECRLNAVTPGKIMNFIPPGGYGVRVDTHIYTGYEVSPYYDSLLAKLIVYGDSRETVIKRMKRVLSETVIEGIETNMPVLKRIVASKEFLKNDYGTNLLDILRERG